MLMRSVSLSQQLCVLTFYGHCSIRASDTMSRLDYRIQPDRHQCFRFGNMPKIEGGQIHLNFMAVL